MRRWRWRKPAQRDPAGRGRKFRTAAKFLANSPLSSPLRKDKFLRDWLATIWRSPETRDRREHSADSSRSVARLKFSQHFHPSRECPWEAASRAKPQLSPRTAGSLQIGKPWPPSGGDRRRTRPQCWFCRKATPGSRQEK